MDSTQQFQGFGS